MPRFTESQLKAACEKIVSCFGLALRAGKCIVGSELCINCMRSSRAKLAIMPCDVSDNTKKKLTNCASFHNVEFLTLPCTGEFLASKLGKRAKVSCAVITDESFVRIIEKIHSDIHTRFTEVQQ